MENGGIPGKVEKAQKPFHLAFGMEHELFVVDHDASFRSDLSSFLSVCLSEMTYNVTLLVHGADTRIPLGQTLSEVVEVEARYRHLTC